MLFMIDPRSTPEKLMIFLTWSAETDFALKYSKNYSWEQFSKSLINYLNKFSDPSEEFIENFLSKLEIDTA